jgi:hypothetical protein
VREIEQIDFPLRLPPPPIQPHPSSSLWPAIVVLASDKLVFDQEKLFFSRHGVASVSQLKANQIKI